ncbi:phosphate ABC transporter permease PstA [Psychromonas sp. MME2]|uniref:phosphate ABC transporter permease PstA n=1 Tax=unclassified Psychromonas TaxID=2614957 RepID=UPI00339C1411
MTKHINKQQEINSMSENTQLSNTDRIRNSLRKRNAKEIRFRWMGRCAIAFGFLMVVILFVDITAKAYPAFYQNWIKIEVELSPELLELSNSANEPISSDDLAKANYISVVRKALYKQFPEVSSRRDRRQLAQLLSSNAEFDLRDKVLADPSLVGKTLPIWFLADDDIDTYLKSDYIDNEGAGRVSEQQAMWLDTLHKKGDIETRFNTLFFTNGDSREPELAGIRGALSGTFLTMLVTLVISFPIGVAAALYLEEFAPKNRWTDLIEVNINNLAAVPSIVFGLLGLAVLINIFGLPRSAPLIGGIVLSLMTLPTIIIASRASIKAVPNSIREAAIGIGASQMQVTLGHVLPIAMPGILTGTIIGLAQALGETAPLLMIGMVAFIVDVPGSFTDAATVMPVQIYLWADSPEHAFLAKTSAAILVLLAFLLVMNLSASLLRKKFEKIGK